MKTPRDRRNWCRKFGDRDVFPSDCAFELGLTSANLSTQFQKNITSVENSHNILRSSEKSEILKVSSWHPFDRSGDFSPFSEL